MKRPDDGTPPRPRARKRADTAPAQIQTSPARHPIRSLVVSQLDSLAAKIGPTLGDRGLVVERAYTLDDARTAMARSQRRPEIVAIAITDTLPAIEAIALVRELSQTMPGVSCVLMTHEPTLDVAVDAMRAGAVDLIDSRTGEPAMRDAIDLAIERVERARQREIRIDRLRGVCKELDTVRQDITSQVSSMCTDLVDAYRELSTQIDRVSLVAEFNGIIRQELEIESLLRASLEFLLAKIGPTNAAVYLPSSSDEFSLGAFVNYDRDPESLSVMLDHLADTLAPRMEERGTLFLGRHDADMVSLLGPHAHWLDAQEAIAISCEHDEECLAVIVMFRDRRSPLPTKAREIFEYLAHPLAMQLGRIIHCHHRHIPKDQWTNLGDTRDEWEEPEDGWNDLAA